MSSILALIFALLTALGAGDMAVAYDAETGTTFHADGGFDCEAGGIANDEGTACLPAVGNLTADGEVWCEEDMPCWDWRTMGNGRRG